MNVTIKGKTYQLPKYTIAIDELFTGSDSKKTVREVVESRYAVLEELLGHESAASLADGETAEDCDIAALATAYLAIKMAYQAPVYKEQAAKLREQINQIRPALDAIELAQQSGVFKAID